MAYNMYASMNGGQAVRKEGVSLSKFIGRMLLRCGHIGCISNDPPSVTFIHCSPHMKLQEPEVGSYQKDGQSMYHPMNGTWIFEAGAQDKGDKAWMDIEVSKARMLENIVKVLASTANLTLWPSFCGALFCSIMAVSFSSCLPPSLPLRMIFTTGSRFFPSERPQNLFGVHARLYLLQTRR